MSIAFCDEKSASMAVIGRESIYAGWRRKLKSRFALSGMLDTRVRVRGRGHDRDGGRAQSAGTPHAQIDAVPDTAGFADESVVNVRQTTIL